MGAGEDYEGYGYDSNGNRVSLRLRSGETIAYTYDALNRETFKDIPGGTGADVTSRYDLSGRRTFARFGATLARGNGPNAPHFGHLQPTY